MLTNTLPAKSTTRYISNHISKSYCKGAFYRTDDPT